MCRRRPARQGISHGIIFTAAVDDAIAEAQQAGEHLLLPRRVEPLLIEMHKAFLVRVDHKLGGQQVMAPSVHRHKNGQVLLLVDGETLIARP